MPETRIKRAMETELSGLRTTPRRRAQMLQDAVAGKRAPRKLPAALVLALVLALTAAGALAAALLSARELAEQKAVPMANAYQGDAYTVADTNILLQLAEENGIALSEAARESMRRFIENGEGYYKGEMLMALAKAQFGEDPAAWSLEEQKWLDEAWVAVGILEEPNKALPGEGEITQAQAEQLAAAHIRAHYDPDVDLTDPARYRTGVQFINGDAGGDYPGRYWSIEYDPLTLEDDEYWVYLDAQGEVLDVSVRPGARAGEEFHLAWFRFREMYGSDYGQWTQAQLRAFRETMLVCHANPDFEQAQRCLENTQYPDVPATALTREQAVRLAMDAVGAQEGCHSGAVYIAGEPNGVWKVGLAAVEQPDMPSGRAEIFVEMDGATGEVLDIFRRDVQDYTSRCWWRDITLERVLQEVAAAWTPPPGNG